MKHVILALSLILAPAAAVAAEGEHVNGVVKKVNLERKTVTVTHEELKSLDMPAMTMVFDVADPAMLDALKDGQDIAFTVERINGRLTITDIKE